MELSPLDLNSLCRAQTPEELMHSASLSVGLLADPVGMVFGPTEPDMKAINNRTYSQAEDIARVINRLRREHGKKIFNHLPFENRARRMAQRLPESYSSRQFVLDFVGPLLTSGCVATVWLLPGWETCLMCDAVVQFCNMVNSMGKHYVEVVYPSYE